MSIADLHQETARPVLCILFYMTAGYMPFLLLYQRETGLSFYRTYQSANEEVPWY